MNQAETWKKFGVTIYRGKGWAALKNLDATADYHVSVTVHNL